MARRSKSTSRRDSRGREGLAAPAPSAMAPGGDAPPEPRGEDGRMSVLVEISSPQGGSSAFAMSAMESMAMPGVELDHEFTPVPMGTQGGAGAEMMAGLETVIVRAKVADEAQLEALRQQPGVVNVWKDTPIAPFATREAPAADSGGIPAMGPCPIGVCDCSPGTPRGTMAEVATYLGVNQIWAAGFRGTGIVVGVLDSGVTAVGRPVKPGETPRRIPRVIGGWPADWGTESSKWGDHGNMCATDVLGMAPDAQIYDLRVAGAGGSPGTISRALQAFQWAIDRYRVDGTPQVLTNSWGIFQESWDPTYARNPAHPFTRKVVEAIDLGILVLFAAGNCGDTCPDGRCGADNGPGRSIWGANGHPRVMTVGAVNRLEQFVGYSSRGPAALDPNKPDFCSITHFTGYFTSDSGTSAATPIAAGVVALLKQAKPALTQDQAKNALKTTAKDIGPPGFDQSSGAGIINAKRAFDHVRAPIATTPRIDVTVTRPAVDFLGTSFGADTNPRIDIAKLPVLDRLDTAPRIDWVKNPGRDTIEEHIGLPQPGRPGPGLRGSQVPFALAMPHAGNWEAGGSSLDELEGQIGALAASIADQQDQLRELYARYQEAVMSEESGA